MKTLLTSLLLVGVALQAATVSCTVNTIGINITPYTTSTPDINGSTLKTGADIAGGFGGGSFTCPAINAGPGNTITSYQVGVTGDYTGGVFGTTTGTEVDLAYLAVGGPVSGAAQLLRVTGGNSSNTFNPPTPFDLGPNVSGAQAYGSFLVTVGSVVTSGRVGASSSQVVLSYAVSPEPATLGLVGSAMLLLGLLARKRR